MSWFGEDLTVPAAEALRKLADMLAAGDERVCKSSEKTRTLALRLSALRGDVPVSEDLAVLVRNLRLLADEIEAMA